MNKNVVVVLNRPGVQIRVLRLAFPHRLQPLLDLFIGDGRLLVLGRKPAVIGNLELRGNLEVRLEPDGLTGLKFEIRDIRSPDDLQLVFLDALAEGLRKQQLQYFVPDFALETRLDDIDAAPFRAGIPGAELAA